MDFENWLDLPVSDHSIKLFVAFVAKILPTPSHMLSSGGSVTAGVRRWKPRVKITSADVYEEF